MQHHKTHYAPVSEAIKILRAQGFEHDFNLKENCIVCNETEFDIEGLEIVDVYRYEGDSDPSDEATVYAIQSREGVKGILVTGYGISIDDMSSQVLAKIKIR